MIEVINNKQFYPDGLPFSETIATNLDDLYDRVHSNNKASMVIIDGGVGEGKTTLATEVADYFGVRAGRGFVDIDKAEQIAMGGADFAKKLKVCYEQKHVTIIYDESGDFNKRGALTRLNAMLNRIFETFRAFKIIVILCLPSFHVLDQDLFDKNIPRLLLHCENRTNLQGNIKAYGLYRMLYVKEKMKKLVVKSFAYNLVQPNFHGHFKNLPEKRRNALDRLSTKGKLNELEHTEVKLEGWVSYQDVANRLQKSTSWVSYALKALGIKHIKIIGRAKYYDRSIVDTLTDYNDYITSRAEKGVKVSAQFIEKFKKEQEGNVPLFEDNEVEV